MITVQIRIIKKYIWFKCMLLWKFQCQHTCIYYFKQKKNICVFITLGKNSVFRIKVVNANKIINMLPYTKVKKQKQTLTYNMSI